MDDVREVKRYRNRRLYDTESRRTITQADLARLVQEGQRVRVTDFATGEDITVAVLGQIATSQVATWPDREEVASLFRSLIERGGVGVKAINNAILAGLGAITLTREKAEEIVDALIKKGELARGDRKMAIDDLITKAEEQAKKFSDTLKTRAAELRGVKREEYEALQKQVEALRMAMEKLEAKLAEKGGA
jgi:polyhydroxyalkanoate synthesis repressor PhaR